MHMSENRDTDCGVCPVQFAPRSSRRCECAWEGMPLSGTQQQASHKEAEVFVAVVERWLVGIGFGWGYRRSGEEEAGGLGRRQHHPLFAASLVTGGGRRWRRPRSARTCS
jgi:hypothetical protein